ncbi:hypothetical protein CBR_g48914 [Chara braunii]|uniref:Reverse transcriptase domain-containing protein n=1 Tax=Chara braunii TaxID=69332 RepID=A0A388M3T9_CHABU|nr:hypothetical protein CBR_g48914 [Chara braunii]|eukprot:GBG89206.1 hypothetical protein CBR_g48914 [Chara braunii]
MIIWTNIEPAVRNYIELQAVVAGYERIDLTEWLKVTPVRTLEDLLIARYQDKHAALKARLKLEALKGQTWRSSMQALEQHLTGLFTTPDLGMTDVSCMDVVMGVAPKEYLSLLALKDHTTWRELMTDLVNLEAKDLARRKKAPAAGGKPQRKWFGSSNQLALHDHREAEDQSYADDLSLDDDLEPDSNMGCSTSAIESDVNEDEKLNAFKFRKTASNKGPNRGLGRGTVVHLPKNARIPEKPEDASTKPWETLRVRVTFDKDRTVTHELNFYVLNKCPFDAVIGLGWLKAHCLRTTWADNQFVDDPPPEVPTNSRQLLDRFPEVLAEPRGVPERPVEHKIEIIEGSIPPKGCVYRMGQGELEELRRQIDDMIDRGWIRPSESEFGAPVLFVPKKGGKLRMCIDYRGLNRITRKNAYPLPRIDDLLDAAGGCKVFSKIDLKSGYHQIEVDPSDQHKTAFKTRDGLYEFIVMPFGLTNAPATFQCLMDKVLRHQLNRFVVVYLDDILIFSKTMEEHLKHLEKVLQVLKEAQLHLNLEKYEFGRDGVIYFGHRLSANGLEPETTKVEVIRNWPQPANVHELRSFLGLASYYQNFVPKFSVIAHPLSRLTSKNVAYAWCEKCETAFQALKEALVCQRTKVHRHKPYGLLRPLPIPDGPGESISIDFTDMGKVSAAENSQVTVIVDRFSKFLNLIPFPPHAPAELVIEEFHQQYILQFGVPKTIVSDRDTRFINKDWKDFTSKICDIKLNKTSGRHPEANGLAEEINQTVIQLLRALIVPDQNTWDKELHKVKGLHNNPIHSATGVTPNQVQYGWPMRNPLSYLFPERSPSLMPSMPGYNAKYARLLKAVIAAMNKRQHAMIKHANKLCKEEKFKVGDYVWVKMSEFSNEEGISRKLLPLYYGPW